MQKGITSAQVIAVGRGKDQETMAIYIQWSGIDVKGASKTKSY